MAHLDRSRSPFLRRFALTSTGDFPASSFHFSYPRTVLRTLFPPLKYICLVKKRKGKRKRKKKEKRYAFRERFSCVFHLPSVSSRGPVFLFVSTYPLVALLFYTSKREALFFHSQTLSFAPLFIPLSLSLPRLTKPVFLFLGFSILHISFLRLLSTSEFRHLFVPTSSLVHTFACLGTEPVLRQLSDASTTRDDKSTRAINPQNQTVRC